MSPRFGPAARLRSRAEFTAVQADGRRVAGRYLIVLGRLNGLGNDRLGIIASKRVGGAVQRNRAKRRVRELFRREVLQTPDSAGLDLVVIVRPDLPRAPFDMLTSDFQSALKKVRGRGKG